MRTEEAKTATNHHQSQRLMRSNLLLVVDISNDENVRERGEASRHKFDQSRRHAESIPRSGTALHTKQGALKGRGNERAERLIIGEGRIVMSREWGGRANHRTI